MAEWPIGARLDRRISIERPVTTTNALNEPVQTWAELASVRAEVEQVRDSERYAAAQVGATATHRFRIRWSSEVADIDPTDRVVYEDRAFSISATKEIGRRRGIEITATARAERPA